MLSGSKLNVKEEVLKYFSSSETEIYSKALHLGNLAYLVVSFNDKNAEKGLLRIGAKTSPSALSKIAIRLTTSGADRLQDKLQIDAIEAGKLWLLEHKGFSEKLSTEAIIALGQDPGLCRLAAYRLIKAANPSSEIYLPHGLLKVGDVSSAQVALAYKNVQTLPDELLKLASSEQNAQIIMGDVAEHLQRYPLIKHIVEKHPSLADSVAKNWKSLLSSNELEPLERESLTSVLDTLALQFPQFQGIKDIVRSPRSQLSNEEALAQEQQPKSLATLFSLVWGLFTAPKALTAIKAAGAVGGGLSLGPLLLLGAPMLAAKILENASRKKTEDDDQILLDKKISRNPSS